MTSCSEKADYVYGSSPAAYSFSCKTTKFVYKPDDVIEDIKITITRNETGEEITVPIVYYISDPTMISCDPSVTFEAGSNRATYILHVLQDFELGQSTQITLAIDSANIGLEFVPQPEPIGPDATDEEKAKYTADSIARADYIAKIKGQNINLVTEITVMRDYTWKSIGTGTFRDDVFASLYGVEPIVTKVDMEECEQVAHYYRLVNPYGAGYAYNEDGDYDADNDYYLYVHAEDPEFVYMPTTTFGTDWGNGKFTMADFAGYYIDNGYSVDLVKSRGIAHGTLEDGVITWPVNGLLCGFDGQLDYYANTNGLFYIAMPGITVKSYKTTVSYSGVFVAADGTTSACGKLTVEGDADKAYVCVAPKSADADAVADAIAEGTYDAELLPSGTFSIPFDAEELGTGDLQIVAAIITEEEGVKVVQSFASANFTYTVGENPWQSIGTGGYVEDAVLSLFGQDPARYYVKFEENKDVPGLYRMVDPYLSGENAFPYSGAAAGTYIEINATDPDAVYIPTQSTGLNLGYGEMSLASGGAGFLEKLGEDYFDNIKEAGYFGKLVDGVISFPLLQDQNDEGIYEYQMIVGDDDGTYNVGSQTQIILPQALSESVMKASLFEARMRKVARLASIRGHKSKKASRRSNYMSIARKFAKFNGVRKVISKKL